MFTYLRVSALPPSQILERILNLGSQVVSRSDSAFDFQTCSKYAAKSRLLSRMELRHLHLLAGRRIPTTRKLSKTPARSLKGRTAQNIHLQFGRAEYYQLQFSRSRSRSCFAKADKAVRNRIKSEGRFCSMRSKPNQIAQPIAIPFSIQTGLTLRRTLLCESEYSLLQHGNHENHSLNDYWTFDCQF